MAGKSSKNHIGSLFAKNLKGENSIKKKFKIGMKKALEKVNSDILLDRAIKYAEYAVSEAINNYRDGNEGVSLTGNTVTGFGAGVFVDGKLVKYVSYRDIGSIDGPHHPWTKPGESNFKDYDTGEEIKPNTSNPAVKPYSRSDVSFHGTPYEGSTRERFSYISTERFIREEFVPEKNGITIVVANVSPYIEYIHRVRNMDILDTNVINIESDISRIISK